jgi:hypothetical protein
MMQIILGVLDVFARGSWIVIRDRTSKRNEHGFRAEAQKNRNVKEEN